MNRKVPASRTQSESLTQSATDRAGSHSVFHSLRRSRSRSNSAGKAARPGSPASQRSGSPVLSSPGPSLVRADRGWSEPGQSLVGADGGFGRWPAWLEGLSTWRTRFGRLSGCVVGLHGGALAPGSLREVDWYWDWEHSSGKKDAANRHRTASEREQARDPAAPGAEREVSAVDLQVRRHRSSGHGISRLYNRSSWPASHGRLRAAVEHLGAAGVAKDAAVAAVAAVGRGRRLHPLSVLESQRLPPQAAVDRRDGVDRYFRYPCVKRGHLRGHRGHLRALVGTQGCRLGPPPL
ncbi:hypothetical protein NDU88_003172 [Pleurodeles waltl]|uniref:Uncharacterized protein n=1 Tax=Pleurodeles waltl TaxID=8319 RepID=A0AAV7SES1_PLEWA|nr:hypothetical protein NDU88_003172 [Pleurodeles waltl]